jgi:hypothetical protein
MRRAALASGRLLFAPLGAARSGAVVQRRSYQGPAIPDSVVSRDQDNHVDASGGAKFGIRISVSQEWPEIGAELSSQQDDSITRAYVHRVSDGQLMGDTDISGLSGGDTFTITLDTALQSGEDYNFVVDAEGPGFNIGQDDSPNFPYTSSDGNLEITNGARDDTNTFSEPSAIVTVGDVGF